MTDIKIPFTKIRIVQKNTDPNNSANQVIDLEISTNVLMSHLEPRLDQLHGGNPDNTFARMRFYFLNNAEPALVQDLLNDSKTNFELNFVKEQVAYGVGGAAGEIDNSKPEVNLYQAPTSRMLEVKFSPQFAGIIKLTASGQETPPPKPQSPTPTKITFTKKSAKKADLTELRKSDKEAEGVELEVEPFALNTPHHGEKTFNKIVFIDNQNKNSDKLSLLLDSNNKSLGVNFLSNTKIGIMEPHAFYKNDELPNVTWGVRGEEKTLTIYLNDAFGFKPNEISINKTGESPEKPKDNKDKERERERERERDKPNGPNQPTEKPSQQEITNLKTELNQVKNDLEKLKEFIKKVEDKKKNKWKNNSDLENILKDGKNKLKDLEKKNAPKTSSSDKGFWRKEVVIPLVLVLVVIIFIGIIFWVRKKRIKDS